MSKYKHIAEAIRAAGIPDSLNRYLTMTEGEIDLALQNTKPNRNKDRDMAEKTASKATQLRELRERQFEAPKAKPPKAQTLSQLAAKIDVKKDAADQSAASEPQASAPAVSEPKASAPAKSKESTMRKPAATKTATKAKAKTAAKSTARRKLSPSQPRAASESGPNKSEQLIVMLKGKGSTVPELCKKLGWLPHTLRARLSRLMAPKKDGGDGLKLERERADGVTTYRLV